MEYHIVMDLIYGLIVQTNVKKVKLEMELMDKLWILQESHASKPG